MLKGADLSNMHRPNPLPTCTRATPDRGLRRSLPFEHDDPEIGEVVFHQFQGVLDK